MSNTMQYNKKMLKGVWQFAYIDDADIDLTRLPKTWEQLEKLGVKSHDIQIPGYLELGLVQNGIEKDIYKGKNIIIPQNYEYTHAFYYTTFDYIMQGDNEIQLVLEGVDTYATVYLNGEEIGEADNMFLEYTFDVQNLKTEENELFIHIKPTVLEGRKYENQLLNHALRYNLDSAWTRKAAYMYGWDIFPRIVSNGIWKPVYISQKNTLGFKQTLLNTLNIDKQQDIAQIDLFVELECQRLRYTDLQIKLIGECDGSNFEEIFDVWSKSAHHKFNIKNPKLWWCKGKGKPNLYNITLELLHKGESIAQKTFEFGVRTIALDRNTDLSNGKKGEFCFELNGEKVFVLGTNWVPLDIFPSKGEDKIEKAIEMTLDINCNTIRIWGGGYYEFDKLYELCDKHGIMIWQDFMMGCAVMPQKQLFYDRLEQEITYQVRRLRQHPSLIIWCGDNECDEAFDWTGANINPNNNHITRVLIKNILLNEDYTRPYLPSSPYLDEGYYKMEDKYLVEDHLWGPRDNFKGDFYKNATAHFVSEIGYHGCPNVESIKKFISADKLWSYENNDEWLYHASSPSAKQGEPYNYRIGLMADQIEVVFNEKPQNLEDFSFASQVSQAEAKKYFIERFRIGKWQRTGIIWWNLLDGCPQFSDAVVDYYFNKKLAYNHIKTSQQPVLIALDEAQNNTQSIICVNDTGKKVGIKYSIYDITNGDKTYIAGGETSIENDISASIGAITNNETKSLFFVIEWEINNSGTKCKNHYMYRTKDGKVSIAQYKKWLKIYNEL